jgi:transmembrane sensor
MKDSSQPEAPLDRIAHEAAAWVLRCDRGLTPAEQDAFSDWLAADPRHGAQLARHRQHWGRLDGLAQWQPEHSGEPNPDLLAPPPSRLLRFVPIAVTLAAAAAVAALLFHSRSVDPAATTARPPTVAKDAPAAGGPRVLEDGTVVELNGNAAISVQFTATERRVRLERGEAHFSVTSNPARPFIVNASGIDVRAVGTAFNVRVDATAVEVLVTEGKVRLDSQPAEALGASGAPAPESSAGPLVPLLETRQRAVVSLGAAPPPPQIDTLTAGEIERVLAWHHRLLNFTDAPLREIVAEFNRRNTVQLVILDAELAAVRISASFRSDNIEGFVTLFEAGFGARAERRGDSEIVLRKARE